MATSVHPHGTGRSFAARLFVPRFFFLFFLSRDLQTSPNRLASCQHGNVGGVPGSENRLLGVLRG